MLLLIGIAKKAVVADSLAEIADPLFVAAAAGEPLGAAGASMATFAFGFQIYLDFSGYSDMAIGLALLFGLRLPANFDAPYTTRSIRGFWRRWHMTLSRFLRDYLYVPLGGNRHGRTRETVALLPTMLLGGLWHGAAWTFVAWGGLLGLALAVNHAWQRARLPCPPALGWVMTFVFVMVARVPFRAPDFASAQHVLVSLDGADGWAWPPGLDGADHPAFVPLAAAVALLGPTSQRFALGLEIARPSIAFAAGVALAVLLVTVGGWKSAEFIYFQF